MKGKEYGDGDYDEQEAAKESARQLKAYKKAKGIPNEQRVFKIVGRYQTLRDEMLRRGWVEHDWEP